MKKSGNVVHIIEELEEGFEIEYVVDVSDLDDFYNHFDTILERIKNKEKYFEEDKMEKIKKENPELFSKMTEVVNRYDPAGLMKIVPPDDYETEICAVIPYLKDCDSEEDVSDLMYGVFYSYFVPKSQVDSVKRVIGDRSVYEKMAEEIWGILKKKR